MGMEERYISVNCPYCGKVTSLFTKTFYTEYQTIGCQGSDCNKFFSVRISMNPEVVTFKLEEHEYEPTK